MRPGLIRLQVYLAHAGAASRRASEQLISSGRVTVNGLLVNVLGAKVGPGDEVRLDGRLLEPEKELRYLALHKPPEYLCSASDPQGRPLAREILPFRERLYNVGRLDYRSSGLIFFTNDGDFAARVGHPRSALEKEYLVAASGPIPDAFVEAFSTGIEVEGVFYQARFIERLGRRELRIILVEGKNREIRRVFSHFHLHPERLHRVRIGPVELGNLEAGASRPLKDRELRALALGG
ncbi:MAG: rRNA pseudouridine synthase [Treponema sp.]|nr:rRNA pseudouridine synthase [Treponema sp.]